MVALFEHILKVQDPEGTLDAVRFSMAPALARFASLEALREDSPALIIGVVTPVHPPPEASPGEGRPATGSVAMTLHLEGKVRDDPFVEQLGQFGCGFGTVERGPGFRIDQP